MCSRLLKIQGRFVSFRLSSFPSSRSHPVNLIMCSTIINDSSFRRALCMDDDILRNPFAELHRGLCYRLRTFLCVSRIILTSLVPRCTICSICLLASCKSSRLPFLATSMALSFLCYGPCLWNRRPRREDRALQCHQPHLSLVFEARPVVQLPFLFCSSF